jgi:hypothetical protein
MATTAATSEADRPVLAIYHTHSRPHTTNASVVVALWDDGRIVWSTATSGGGPPYRVARFDQAKLHALLDRLEHERQFSDTTTRRSWFGPDASYTTIAVDDGRRRLRLQSWHEFAEQKTNLIATAGGLEPLAGRDREQLLLSQPADYRRFLQIWKDIRQAVTVLIPRSGEPFDGPININYRDQKPAKP